MRRVVGSVLMLFAVVAAVLGAGIAIVLGTDNRAETGPHEIETSAPVVVTSPEVFSWAGPTLTMRIDVDKDQQLFIGAANAVDIADYVGSTQRTEISSYNPPWSIGTRDVFGDAPLPAAPGQVDWWMAQSTETGSATISVKLPEQAFSLVVIAVGGGDLDGLQVTASYDIDGGFGIGLGLIGFAVGLGLFGWIAVQGRPLVREGELIEDEFEPDVREGV
ncbi:MAG TPA: hypothetical protein VEX15_02850 [Nocardioidaceae bacterium]|nr:hypothetical protein [Nocardioidaceae bacterium]